MRTSLKRLPHALSVGIGGFVGTAIYAFLSATQEVDWYRSIFVGTVAGLIAAAWPRKK